MRHSYNEHTMKVTLIAAMIASVCQTGWAQEATAVSESNDLVIEKIEVTARKRSESLQEVPVAVSALTSDDIEKQGLVSVQDLSDSAPGLVVSNNFSGKTDRSVQSFALRGFSPSSGAEATVSMFIDGVPVTSTTALSSIGSPERIEILRGPQSAYFGRNTFAGAINVVNRKPNQEWAGSISGTAGNYGYTRLRGEVEGTLVDDQLSFRLAGETYEKDGAWDNHFKDGGRLGDQQTDMASLYIEAQPTDSFSLKAFGFYSKDEDGPAPSAFISAVDILNYEDMSVLVEGQSNCVINGNPYFCSVPTKSDPLSYNTDASQELRDLIKSPTNRVASTSLLDNYGMGREFVHGHLVADWEITDEITLSTLTGFNNEEWVLLNDIDHYGNDYFNYPFLVDSKNEDVSQELRLTYQGDGPLSGTVGLSYLDAEKSGTQTTAISFNPVPSEASSAGSNKSTTHGLFFGLSYEMTQQASLSVEGRFQKDKIAAYNPDGSLVAEETFDNFLPRVILDYKVSDDLMVYGSYSKGVNPSAFNAGVLALPDNFREQAEANGLSLTVKPEEVVNYEVGMKGSLLNGSLNYALGAYYAQWNKQINRINLVFVDPEDQTQTQSFSGVANAGDVDLWGLEFESHWMLTSSWRLNVSAAYVGSDINEYVNPTLTALSGVTDFSGKEQAGVSKLSGNLGVQYTGVIADEYDYFLRSDYVYKSGQWLNAANFLKTEDIHKVNLRAGVYIGDLELQAYVKNVFDNDEYTFGYDYYAFDPTYAYFNINSGLVMSLQEPRTFGIQAKYSFY
ncbi:MAG: TonB-dependent receptor [Alteromonadaceae bacterium]|nr:TonB-dependent receptor [Alteromonadaceae bacterium]